MISRLTAVSTTFAVLFAALLIYTGTPRASITVASNTTATAKQVRFIELEPVIVTGKRL